jgi:hypothetical protein
MKLLNLIIIMLVNIMLIYGCGKSSCDKTFYLEIKDASGKIIAKGSISLPNDIEETVPFTSSYKINILDMPQNPSNENEYAIRSLSQKNGEYSGTIKNENILLTLQPRVSDNDIYFDGKYNGQIIEGKCTYQSYAGTSEFGTFIAKPVKK